MYDHATAGGARSVSEGLLAGSTATVVSDETGVQIVIKTATALPDSALCVMAFFTESEQAISPNRRSGGRYRNGDGQLVIPGVVDGNTIAGYLPGGAMPGRVSARIRVLVTLAARKRDGSVMVLGQTPLLMDAPAPRPWCQVELIEPLVVLAMRVARADGKLLAQEIRQIRDRMEGLFELEARDQKALRTAMKSSKPELSNHALLQAVHRRLPLIQMEHVLEVLVEVARCDGVVSASEIAIVRELVIGYYGASPEEWAAAERALGLGGGGGETAEKAAAVDHWAVLSVSRGASRVEIKKAYHAKMRAYHPDKVANLPEEFQQLAHQKTIEIRAAYEALLKVVG